MRQWIWLVGALLLLVASCGGEAATTTATTGAAPTSTTTTPEATVTTEDPVAYRLMLATILAGEWVGEWQNATSGDRGAVLIGVRVDTAGRTATITIDLGGEAFGQPDGRERQLLAVPVAGNRDVVMGCRVYPLELPGDQLQGRCHDQLECPSSDCL